MNDQIAYHENIDMTWHMIRRIREKVEALVLPEDERLAYACKMVSSELVENAVKYGETTDDTRGKFYDFSLDDTRAKVVVSNRIVHLSDLENVTKHIDDIRNSEDPCTLYLKRLSFLTEGTAPEKSGLGLYRIACEGGFELAYDYVKEKNVLTVTAVKNRFKNHSKS